MKILITENQLKMIRESYETDVIDPSEYSRRLVGECKEHISLIQDKLKELNEMGYDFTKEYKLTGKPIYKNIVDEIDGTIPVMIKRLTMYNIQLTTLSDNIRKIYV